jgi:hypothetical protein
VTFFLGLTDHCGLYNLYVSFKLLTDLFLGLCGLGGQLVRRHAHVVEDVCELARVDAAVVGHVLLTTLVHVEVAS